NAIGLQPARHGGETVGFFYAQLFEAGHFGGAFGKSGGHGEDGVFVDHRGGAFGGNADALQTRMFHPQIGDVLAARHAAVLDGNIAAHFDQRVDQPGAGGVHEDVFDHHFRARHDQRGNQREAGRGGVAADGGGL